MLFTSSDPSRHNLKTVIHPNRWGIALNHAWQWLTLVRAADPVRQMLNRGFATITLIFILLDLFLIPVLFVSGEYPSMIVATIAVPLLILMWWLNRKGTVYGAVLYTVWNSLAIVLGSLPSNYAEPNTPIPLLLIFPIVIASLFIRPQAALWTLALLMSTHAIQLAVSNVPPAYAWRFLIVATLDLAAVSVVLMVGTSLFRRALGTSIAINKALEQENRERIQAEQALREQSHLTEALRNTIIAMTSTLNLDDVMERLLENIESVVPHDTASILLITNGTVRVAYSRNYPPEVADALRSVEFSMELPKFQMLATGRPHLVLNTQDDPYWIPTPSIPELDWIRSHISAPVMVRGTLFGVLSVDSARQNFFTEEYAERLLIFARQAAIAIENAQLYQESQQRTLELEQHVADRTAELQRRQIQLSTILDSLGEGVFYSEGLIVRYANRALADLTGYTLDEIIEQPDGIAKMPAKSSLDLNEMGEQMAEPSEVQNQTSWQEEIQLIRKDGRAYGAALTVSNVRNSSGQVVGSVTVIRDVTKEKQLNAQKSAFIANASHELRTPLTSLKTRLYLMQRQPERQAEHLSAAEKAAKRMMLLLEDLLDTTRFERGSLTLNLQPVILQNVLKEIIQFNQLEAELKKIVLTLTLCEVAVTVNADASRLTQVIVNLLVNAINYTPEGGRIGVTLLIENNLGRALALIQIADTGIGIAAEHLSHIFEPFYRVNEAMTRGTGLGLSISKTIIELHNGTVEVQSEIGKGSIFSIRLALSEVKPKNGTGFEHGHDV